MLPYFSDIRGTGKEAETNLIGKLASNFSPHFHSVQNKI